MARVTKFEELEVWQRARHLTQLVYRATADGDFSRDYGLRGQIRRAAVSVMSNIAEGFERGGDNEFRQFLSLAKGSVGEVRSQLYVALDTQLLTKPEFDRLHALSVETVRMIAGLMGYLGKSEFRGSKFR